MNIPDLSQTSEIEKLKRELNITKTQLAKAHLRIGGENSEDCVFCNSKSPKSLSTGNQENPQCALCSMEAEVEQLRNQLRDSSLEKILLNNLQWLEDHAPYISHDAWNHSVDMAGNRWTIEVRINGKRERIRGKTLIDTIEKARAALKTTNDQE